MAVVIAYHIAIKQGTFKRAKVRPIVVTGDSGLDHRSAMPWLILLGLPPSPVISSYLTLLPFGLINQGPLPLKNVRCQIAYPPHLAPDRLMETDFESGNYVRRVESFPHLVLVDYEISTIRPGEHLCIREPLLYRTAAIESLADLDPSTLTGKVLDRLSAKVDVITMTLLADNLEPRMMQIQVIGVPCPDYGVLENESKLAVPLAMALATRGQRITHIDGLTWFLVGKIYGTRPVLLHQKSFTKITSKGVGIDDLLTQGRFGEMQFFKMRPTLFNSNILAGCMFSSEKRGP